MFHDDPLRAVQKQIGAMPSRIGLLLDAHGESQHSFREFDIFVSRGQLQRCCCVRSCLKHKTQSTVLADIQKSIIRNIGAQENTVEVGMMRNILTTG
jgi:hypothetical protein